VVGWYTFWDRVQFKFLILSYTEWKTNLPNAFKDSSNDDADEASCMCYDWRQDSEYSGPEDAEQQQSLSSEPLCQHPAGYLRRHVAVEEWRQNDALLAISPVEFTLL